MTQKESEPEQTAVDDSDITLYDLDQYFEGCWVLGKRDPVLGNRQTRMAAVLIFSIGDVSVVLRGESGSGKTKLLNAAGSLVWGDEGLKYNNPDLFIFTEGSSKSQLTEEVEARVAAATHCIIPELQNVTVHEPTLKLWMEDRPMRYDRAVKEQGCTDFVTRTYVLEPLSVFTCLADGNEVMPDLTNEMQRRVLSLCMKSSEALNIDIHTAKAEARFLPEADLIGIDPRRLESLQQRILRASRDTRRVINPGATEARKVIPPKYTISNTFIGYFFDMVETVTKFYADQRINDSELVFSDPGDNYVAHLIVGDQIRDLSVGMPPGLGHEILKFLPVSEFMEAWEDLKSDDRSNRPKRKHIDEILDYLSGQGMPRQKKVIKEAMDKLVGSGYAKVDDKGLYYKTGETEFKQEVNWKTLITECRLVMEEHWPNFQKDYVERPTTYINPFTGKAEDIPEKTIQTVKPVESDVQLIADRRKTLDERRKLE